MSIFKQRPFIIAIIAAPLLAIASYFLTGFFMNADPAKHQPKTANLIKIKVHAPCRLLTSPCTGKSEDGRVTAHFEIMPNDTEDTVTFEFRANRPLEHAIVQIHPKSEPHLMDDHGAGKWQIKIDKRYLNEMKSLNFATQHEKALYVTELSYR